MGGSSFAESPKGIVSTGTYGTFKGQLKLGDKIVQQWHYNQNMLHRLFVFQHYREARQATAVHFVGHLFLHSQNAALWSVENKLQYFKWQQWRCKICVRKLIFWTQLVRKLWQVAALKSPSNLLWPMGSCTMFVGRQRLVGTIGSKSYFKLC